MVAAFILGSLARIVLAWALPGEGGQEPLPGQETPGRPPASPPEAATLQWKEGVPLPVRVPVVGPGRELLTTLAFPEESIETAVTGWPEGEITAVVKRGLLFLRLTHKSEGQLSVIGGSGTHYLFYLQGVDSVDPGAYDAYLRIRKKEEAQKGDPLPRRSHPRPGAAVELLEAMRLGLHPQDSKIYRARRELALETSALEVRLLFVYDSPAYRGLIFEVRNLTSTSLALDASRFQGKGASLVLSALRENLLEPKGLTRLYALTWKDEIR